MNTVTVRDKVTGSEWHYDISDPEEWDFLSRTGEWEGDILILTLPQVAAIKRWDVSDIMNKVENAMDELGIPEIVMKLPKKQIEVVDWSACSDQDLQEHLTQYGGWKAYLDAQMSYLEAKKLVLERGFEEGMFRAMASLSAKIDGRKPAKDILHGEAIAKFPRLRDTKIELVEAEALYVRLSGVRNAFKSAYDSVSRVVALRSQMRMG